jgi:hypothetical protein
MSRIETLTPEQEALIPVYRDKWRAIALSNSPLTKTIGFMQKQNPQLSLLMDTACTLITA